jgi:hypothetical protein
MGGESREADAFYTKASIATHCVDQTIKYIDYQPDVIIEPSAGDGVFVNCIKLRFPNSRLVAVDIAPTAPDIIAQDFYKTKRSYFGIDKPNLRVLVVGNPPFGKNASDAVGFFNHAASVLRVQTISMILPRTFRKTSVVDRLDVNYHLVHEEILPPNSFRFRENKESNFVDYDVPTVLQIWNRGTTRRVSVLKKRSPESEVLHFLNLSDVKKKKTDENVCDVVIQRVGVAAGRANFDPKYAQEKKNSGNYYFITVGDKEKFKQIHDNAAEFSEFLEKTPAKFDCAGMPSITKDELMDRVDEYFTRSVSRKTEEEQMNK